MLAASEVFNLLQVEAPSRTWQPECLWPCAIAAVLLFHLLHAAGKDVWNTELATQTMNDSLNLFSALRRKGIRAHSCT